MSSAKDGHRPSGGRAIPKVAIAEAVAVAPQQRPSCHTAFGLECSRHRANRRERAESLVIFRTGIAPCVERLQIVLRRAAREEQHDPVDRLGYRRADLISMLKHLSSSLRLMVVTNRPASAPSMSRWS